MKIKQFIFMYIFLLSANCAVFADRILERAEILQIFQQLTSQPKKTWIQAGTINALHEEFKARQIADANEINRQIKQAVNEYRNNSNKPELTDDAQLMKLDAIPFNVRHKLANEYNMSSSVVLKFDGDKFYWEINADSRQDSVKPAKDLSSNYMTNHFDMNWNAKRIFAWDGEKYTTYFLPGNHAMVDSTGTTPHAVNGPLTAGIVPWGYGFYTYQNLSASESSAVETYADGQAQVQLTVNTADDAQMVFILDPQKSYAPLSYLIYKNGSLISSKQYSDFKQVSGNWIPYAVVLEQYEQGTNRLLARDIWSVSSIDANVPQPYEFEIDYQNDAIVEHAVFSKTRPEEYRHSQRTDTNLLLAERMEYESNEGIQPQNCATSALKYVGSKLNKNFTGQQLAELIESNGQTSMLAMKQFVQSQGLYCRAVRADIESLKNLNDCKAILYIPGKKHFVVLDSIDDKNVWTIDLSNSKFYYRTDINFFDMDWSGGVALLISNSSVGGELTEINADELQTITGFGYQCTKLLQGYDVIFCEYIGGLCGGKYTEFPTRYGCESGEGSCSTSSKIRYAETLCIIDAYFPEACDVTGEWTCYYMRACL